MDHIAPNGNFYNYLTVREGDLVNVLDEKGLNYLVTTIPAESSDEEEEGYVPMCCLEPIHSPPDINLLNRNNNNSLSPPCVNDECRSPQDARDLYLYEDSGDEHESNPANAKNSSHPTLVNEWSEFCARTGRFEDFPDCQTEEELLQAKMEALVKYHMEQQFANVAQQQLSETELIHDDIDNENNTESHDIRYAIYMLNEHC